MRSETFSRIVARVENSISVSLGYRPPNFFFYRRNYQFRNFGDELSPVLVSAMLKSKCSGKHWSRRKKHQRLLAIGSILHFAQDNDVIWGSGVNGRVPRAAHDFSHLDVRSVRGPLTRSFLQGFDIEVPEIFGDPALLAPKYLKMDRPKESLRDFSVIPHYDDLKSYAGIDNLVSPLQPLKTVINRILVSRKVISSSLHGIILAEAYGIPAVLMLPQQDEKKILKYRDYFEGTLRSEFDFATSLDEALKMKGTFLPKNYSIGKLEESFPYDFFK